MALACSQYTLRVVWRGTDSTKVAAVKEWQYTRCTQDVKYFLGFVGCYRKVCPAFAMVARPLNALSRMQTKFKDGVFQQLKASDTLTTIRVP